ncbi:hypothetical protein ACFPIJ_39030 [Dactylosporangium cerinum]|uniref:Uncharacterized protein n=1 Tax=Dactylosporangium cerinum TaxID=1434730 RepID=A0ABV9W8I8_9ACTN
MQLSLHLPFQLAVTRSLHHAARLAAAGIGGLGTDVPDPQLWAEMAPDLALRRISRQAEAHYAAATKGRP